MKRTVTSLIILLFSFLLTLSGYSQFLRKTVQDFPIYYGSTDVKDLFSPALQGNLQGNSTIQPVKVYLPPNYESFPDNQYPVIYLLHQFTTDYNLYFNEYGIVEKLDRLISQKTIKPLILVTPNAKTAYGGSWYTNTYISGNWEEYITSDVFQHITNNYHVLNQRESRGIAGFSSAGNGSMNIAMKYPSVLSAIATIGFGLVDMELFLLNDPWKSWTIEAATINEFRPGDPWYIHAIYSNAEAFAPDSTAIPILGRLPYTSAGDLIDSTWQEWMEHDPITRIGIFKDSLMKLDTIQLYVGNQDDMHVPGHENLHQAMIDNSIPHGYVTYSGGHDPGPVLEDVLIYFSESLFSVVPTIRLLNEESIVVGDTLLLKSDKNGSIYIVPDAEYKSIDSIIKYQVATTEVLADQEKEVYLSDWEPGDYQVYAISEDNIVSNIPEEFSISPTNIDDKIIPSFEIYPNPVHDILLVETESNSVYIVEITSINGQIVFSRTMEGTTHQLDLSSFLSGVYFISIHSNNYNTTKKIVKL